MPGSGALTSRSNMCANDRAGCNSFVAQTDGVCGVPCFQESLVNRLRGTMPTDKALEEVRTVFAALADRTRLKILHALAEGEELCVGDVAHVLGMSISAASHHLRKLRDLKILKSRNDGKLAFYSLRDRFAAQLADQALRQAGA